MKPGINIQELAEKLGISTATVSRAFSGNGRISAATRERVLAAAEAAGYHPSFCARGLSGAPNRNVLFAYPEFNSEGPDHFLSEIQHGLSGVLRENGLTLQAMPFPDAAGVAAARELLLDGRAGALAVVAGATGSRELFELAQGRELPAVVIGHLGGVETDIVEFDSETGAFAAGQYFRRTGRRRAAYVGGYLDRRKRLGFREGFGAEVAMFPGGAGFRFGVQAFEQIQRECPDVDCVLCANDVLAIGMLRAARSAGVEIPGKLAVIGFDDMDVSRYFIPALSSVSLHPETIGGAAGRMLMRRLSGPPQSRECVGCDLIIRESS